MSDLLNKAEVSKRLGVSVSWVVDHAVGRRRPILPSIKIGKVRRFRAEAIEDFIRQYESKPETEG